MSKKVSIIIPVYNQATSLGSCLESLLQQTYHDWEVIIVNDGSTDELEAVIKTYQPHFQSEQYTYISKNNEGSNPTRNRGAELARGEFLLFCDADITLKNNCLALMMKTLENHPEASFAYSSFYYGAKLFRSFPYDLTRLRTMPYIHTTALLRREHFPGFDNTIKRFQDWDLWLTMSEQNHCGIWINQALFSVRIGGTISTWLPAFAYTLLPFLPAARKYQSALKIIKEKHGLV